MAVPAAGQKAATTETPTNLFETILALVGAAATYGTPVSPQPPAEAQSAIGLFTSNAQATTTAAAVIDPTVVAPVTPDTAAPVDETPDDLLAGLIDQVTALQDELDGGAPLDPASERTLAEAIEALAMALGIPMPPTPTIDPAITAAGSVSSANALDPLSNIEAATAAPTAAATVQATTGADATLAAGAMPPTDGESPIVATSEVATAPVATAPMAATAAVTTPVATAPVASTTNADAAPAPAPLVQKLAEKLSELATALTPKAPELARKLEALSVKLTSGEIDTATLAKLGLDVTATTDSADSEIAEAIDRLLAPRAELRPAPAPAAFTAATLALPDLGASKSTGDSATTPVAAEPKVADAEPDIESATPAPKSPRAQPDSPEAAPARGSFHAAFEASLKDSAATQSAPPQTSATPPVAVVGTAVAADTKAMHAAYKAPVQQVNMPQMAVEIVRQVEAGNSRFQIRLDPPELGRIDVKLDVDKAGNVSARMTVERAETLDLVQRDQRSPEKALAQAGLDSSKTNLEFSLRQSPFGRDGQQQQQQQGGGNSQPGFPRFGVAEADVVVPAPQIATYRGYASASGVNLFV